MEDTKLTLAFGRRTYPDDVQAVWGARLIWPNDFLNDRQDLAAHTEEAKNELIDWLNNCAIGMMREHLRVPSSVGMTQYMTHEQEVVIYEDGTGKIVGSPQKSGGYIYVCGWLHGHTKS